MKRENREKWQLFGCLAFLLAGLLSFLYILYQIINAFKK